MNLCQTVSQSATILAPEFFNDFEKFNGTKPLEIYSYGLLLFEIWSEQKAFSEFKTFCKMLDAIMKGFYHSFPPNSAPDIIRNLVYECLSFIFNKRPDISSICKLFETQYMSIAEDATSFDRQLFDNYIQLMRRKSD